MKKSLLIITLLCIVPFAAAQLMGLQGVVTDSAGNPADGNVTFLIYDNATGGSLVYNSSDAFDGSLSDGKYDVLLGSQYALNLTYGTTYYLDMLVNGEDQTFDGSARQAFESSTGPVRTVPAAGSGASLTVNGTQVVNGSSSGADPILHVVPSSSWGSGLLVGDNTSARRGELSPGFAKFYGIQGSGVDNHVSFQNQYDQWNLGLAYPTYWFSGNATNHRFYIQEHNGSEYLNRFVIQNSTGNVGIGVNDPQQRLHVNGSAQVSDVLRLPPQAAPLACSQDAAGAVYMDNSSGVRPCYCNGTSWVRFENNSAVC